MRKTLLITAAITIALGSSLTAQDCDISANATPLTITCGNSTVLSAFGSSTGSVVLDEDFNSGGFGPGWSSTPGSTSFSNPCSPGGVDGTPHAWMDNNTSVPRTLTSSPYDLSGATAGVTICFDLLFAEQGDAAPCEGPDEPDEGVYLQYSTDGGTTWIDVTYFDPNGGNDPQLTNWNNWCFTLPAGAITANTMIRWHQTADSGADYDHWGIDNVEIFQNDINSEIIWLHDGYSYGVGNSGGDNPTPVSPITSTTYTAQITTGTGDVCTADVTVIVVDPVYEVDVTAAPTTICDGDCATISGTAVIVVDPGGIETYENNQTEFVGSGQAAVNINIQTLNMTGVDPGSILEICINSFDFSGSEFCSNFSGCDCNGTPISWGESCDIDASSFNITVTSPNGCVITLVPAYEITTTGIQDMCFIPSGGAPISSGSGNYSGQFDPNDPISNLDGCDANGVWTLEFNTGNGGFGFGFGSLTGWNITFDDPPIYAPVDIAWSPTTDLTNPTSINTDACPTTSTDYELTVSNGTPGCAVYTETVSITVDPCTGCTPPTLLINPLSTCAPGTVDLSSAVGAGSDPATLSYHGTQLDAQNDVNPIGTTVGVSGSYWVRAEDPTDPACYLEYEIVVTINPQDDASFTLTDFCAGSANAASGIVTPGGTFAFNPVPGGGVTINATTGEITNGVAGSTYTVEYTTSGACSASSTETVNVTSQDDASFTLTDFCAGSANAASGIVTPGGTFAFNPVPGGGVTINATTGEITNGVAGSTYTVEYTTSGACSASSTETVNVTSQDDASFTLTDFCPGSTNAASGIVTPGGTFAFNPVPGGGVTINATTGEITNGVAGSTYTVEYTTSGACSATSTETVNVTNGFTYNVSVVDENCGAGDGQINLTSVGGTPAYTYSIDGGTTSGGPSFTGLSAGNYNILITDINGCTATGNEAVANLGGPSIDNITPVNETCFGACDGSITVTVSGGNPPYSYQWYDNVGAPIGPNANTISNLCDGDYSVEVSDASGGTTQLFYDDFETGAAGWNLASIQGPEGADPNFFEVDDDESGVPVGGCGIAGNGNATLHITSVWFPGGGAAYDAGGGCGFLFCPETNRQAESPMINTVGQTGLTLNFDFIAEGDIPNDQATVWYNDGFGWTQLGAPLYSGTGACAPQGIWTAYSAVLPASCENIANLQIALRWVNNDDGVGTDPSVAINNIEVVTTTAAACTSTDFATLTPPIADDPSFTLTDFCVGAANSATGITTPGGSFDFNPNPLDGSTINATTGEITSPVAGTTYSIEYTTPGACPETSIETVNVTSQDDASFTLTDFCAGTPNAASGIVTPGGTFAFNPAPGGGVTINTTTGEITNGVAGSTYTVEYTTSGACSATSTETVNVTSEDDASFTLTDFCAGSANAASGIVTPGGTFTFNPVPGGGVTINATTGEITNGVAGSTYTVEYTTSGACSASTTETVNVTSQDDASFTLTDFCAGSANAASGIVTPGGTFAFNPVPGGGVTINTTTGEISNGVGGSTYTVEYTTSGACSASTTETINVISQDDPSFTLTDFCAGSANAASGIVTPGGTFAFNPNPGGGVTINSATGEITNPVAGTTYSIEYTTAGTCPASSIESVDAQICCDVVLDTTSTVSPSCGQADGEIYVQAVGGDGSYTYSLDGGPFLAANSFTGLTSGSYDIEVQDGSGVCSDIITVILSDLNAPVITAVNLVQPLCNGDNTGEIEVVASGGVGVLTYELVDGVPIATNGTGDFTGLGAANYTINVTDANGCVATSNGEIIEPSVVTVDVMYTDANCFGANDGTIDVLGGGGTPTYSYSIDNGATWSTNTSYSGLSPQLYQVIVEDDNGCQSIVEDVTIVENGAFTVNSDIIHETCANACDGSITWNVVGGNAPFTYEYNGINSPSNTVNDLCDGVYNYTITDNSGCAAVGSDTIQPAIVVQPSIVLVNPDGCTDICDGQIVVTSNTGVSYSLNGITNGTGIFTDLCEGSKLITVTDANGCTNNINVFVGGTAQSTANFTYLPSTITIFENTVYFTNESITADQFIWEITGDNGYYVSYNSVDIEHVFPSDTGEYVVCLTAINAAGCVDEYCITLVVEDEIAVFVPNTFTPDGDELNQTFRAYVNGVDIYDFDFYIFNRWGELIWENHNPEIGWDGTYNGQMVQAGTYIWKIVVKDMELDFRSTYTGHVNILK